MEELRNEILEAIEEMTFKGTRLNECIYEAKKIIKANRTKVIAYEMFKKWGD